MFRIFICLFLSVSVALVDDFRDKVILCTGNSFIDALVNLTTISIVCRKLNLLTEFNSDLLQKFVCTPYGSLLNFFLSSLYAKIFLNFAV